MTLEELNKTDGFPLLNMTREEFEALGHASGPTMGQLYGAEEIEETLGFLDALRTLFTALAGEDVSTDELTEEQAINWSLMQANKLLQDRMPCPARSIWHRGPMQGITADTLNGFQINTHLPQPPRIPVPLVWVLAETMEKLFNHLLSAAPKTIFVCKQCRKIGLQRSRNRQRFCSDACKMADYRRRKKVTS